MSVADLLNTLGLKYKTEGDQIIVDCPSCGKPLHCYLDAKTGLWHCKVCEAKGNPFTLVAKIQPNMLPGEIMSMLDQCDLTAETTTQQPEKKKQKDLSWLRDKLRKPLPDEIQRVCKVKGLSYDALLTFGPYAHKTEPLLFLPGREPGNSKVTGFLRVHLDGELVPTKSGPQKYPILGNWGLMGLPVAPETKAIIFAEGFGDAISAVEAGFTAIANIGGTGWRDAWLPLFKDRTVYLVPDADKPGYECVNKRARAIYQVAKIVSIVELPYKLTETHGRDLRDFLQGR